jgi:methyl-accepting chemotaxis protein
VSTPLDEIAVVAALDALRRELDESARLLEAASSAVAREHGQLEAVTDAARALPGRGRDVRASLGVVHESLERAKLGALNAGLEAARVGEPLGRLVMQLAGDQRDLVTRALDSLEAHAALVTEAEEERERWLGSVANAREAGASAVEQLVALSRRHAETKAALDKLEQGLEPVLGTDPRTARLLMGLSEQAEKLAAAIGELSADARTVERLDRALSPILQALGQRGRDGG